MREIDYIKATNRVKVSAALSILRDVLPGKEYGITEKELSEIKKKLAIAEGKLFSSYELQEDS